MKNTADLPVPTELRTARVGPSQVWRSAKRWLVPYILISLAGIFYIPQLVPSAQSASDSYLFGYNNRIGIILLLFFIALGAFLTRGFELQAPDERNTSEPVRLPRWMLSASLLLVGFGCTAMYLVAGRYHGFGESFYLIDRITLLQQGRIPYRDFEFVYGPAQIYGPLLLHRLPHLNLGDAYYLFWALSYLTGTYLLFKCIDDVRFPAPSKPAIFAMLFAAGLFAIIRMGTNYTFLRYALPLCLTVKLNARFRDSRTTPILIDALICGIFCTLLVLSSPETAVAFAFASGCVALFCRSIVFPRRALIAATLLAIYGVIFTAALKAHVFDAMLADGGGAISFPIVPGLPILIYFASLFITACWLYCAFLNRATDDSTLGLLFFSIPMVAAALGRCDPSHVFWNGLATFLASSLYISLFRKIWLVYALTFLFFVFIAPNITEFYLFWPQLSSAQRLNKHSDARPSEENLENFLAQWPGSYIAPFGFRPDGFGTYHSPRIEYGAYQDLIDVSTPHSVQRKVLEMSSNPNKALVLPYHYDEYCRSNERTEKHYLEALLLVPYVGNFQHRDFAREPICRYIDEHYKMVVEPSLKTWSYGIWAPLNTH